MLISPISRQGIKLLRVAAYCRVSSSSADQLNSYATQIDYYTRLAKKKKNEWNMVEIFADEGISGMKAKNRPEFQRMIRMCELHQLDLIITKSVSRFARNVKEALEYVRKLKFLGVGIIFEKEGINTQSLGDEMLLNTFTAIAQEESKAISQNQRLSIVKRMELGIYVDSNAPYGFRLENKQLVEYPPEADIVRWIFHSYLNGMSTTEIAKVLTERGIPTKNGKEKWKSTKISYMLSNERYRPWRGSIITTTLCTHASIIEKGTFDKAQVLLQKRKEQFTKSITFNTYPLTSRIRCSECGSFYRRKVRSGGVKWICAKHEENTKSCNSNYYSEERIYDGFLSVVNKLRFGQENILGQVIAKLESATQKYKRNNKTAMQISQKIAEINATILKLNELRSKGYLAPEIHQSQVREMQKQLCTLKEDRQDQFESRILTMLQDVRKLKSLIDEIEEPLDEFDEKLFEEIIVGMALNNADELTVTLLGGLKFTELI